VTVLAPRARPRSGTLVRAGAVAAVVLLVARPAPALAHLSGPPPSDAPYYQTLLTGITPRLPGIAARVGSNGDWIEMTVSGRQQVVVSGYGGEPYLLLTGTGVWQNDLSPTVYLNQSLFVDTSALTAARSSAAPHWRRIAAAGTARWHDHRIHWMGVSRPPSVAADPSHRHAIGDWSVRARAGATPFEVRGTLTWIGRPDQVLGMPLTIAVTLCGVAVVGLVLTWFLVLRARRAEAARLPGPPRPRSADLWRDLAPGAGSHDRADRRDRDSARR
jgi:hypothetical protein